MNPYVDEQVMRGVLAADTLEAEIRQLIKIWRKMDTILKEKTLTQAQRQNLNELIKIVKIRERILEGDWQCRDIDYTKPELKI
jgi:hypothetical protein